MELWLMILIPLVVLGISYFLFPHKVTMGEVVIPILVALILIPIVKFGIEKGLVTDTEYWGAYATKIEYIEEWDEYVHKTCTRTSTNSEGKTTTKTYDCSYVDNHPPKWIMYGSCGETISISSEHYAMLKSRWSNEKFVEMNRDFHRIDGDAYESFFNGNDSDMEPIVTTHSWTNKVQASSSVFKPKVFTQSELSSFGVHNYPKPDGYGRMNSILGDGIDYALAVNYLNIQNAKWGSGMKVRMWLLTFPDQPLEAAIAQEAHWLKGNKNDLVLCLGTSATGKGFNWAYVFSWTPNEALPVSIRDNVMKLKSQSLLEASKVLVGEAIGKGLWRKRDFKEFDYLSVETPIGILITCYVVMFIVSIGYSIWAVVNNQNADTMTHKEKWKISHGTFNHRR